MAKRGMQKVKTKYHHVDCQIVERSASINRNDLKARPCCQAKSVRLKKEKGKQNEEEAEGLITVHVALH